MKIPRSVGLLSLTLLALLQMFCHARRENELLCLSGWETQNLSFAVSGSWSIFSSLCGRLKTKSVCWKGSLIPLKFERLQFSVFVAANVQVPWLAVDVRESLHRIPAYIRLYRSLTLANSHWQIHSGSPGMQKAVSNSTDLNVFRLWGPRASRHMDTFYQTYH